MSALGLNKENLIILNGEKIIIIGETLHMFWLKHTIPIRFFAQDIIFTFFAQNSLEMLPNKYA